MEEYEIHPTQKPKILLERIIKVSTRRKGLVLDLFSGTFTTSSVAKDLNRKSIGIEISEDFVKIGLRRIDIRRSYKLEKLEKLKKPYVRKNKKIESDEKGNATSAKVISLKKKKTVKVI